MLNWERFIIGSDSHGDMVDPEALKVFKKFNVDYQAKHRWHLGDIWDFRPFRGKASEEERREPMLHDFNEGMKFLKWYKPTQVTLGNHDDRLWKMWLANKGPMSDYAGLLANRAQNLFKSLKTEVKPYRSDQGIISLGHMNGIHGYDTGPFAAKRAAESYGCVFMGHGHGIQTANLPTIKNIIGRMIGCLCNLYMEYGHTKRAQLMHRHGFVFGEVNRKTGDFFSHQAECINGVWRIPSGWKEYK